MKLYTHRQQFISKLKTFWRRLFKCKFQPWKNHSSVWRPPIAALASGSLAKWPRRYGLRWFARSHCSSSLSRLASEYSITNNWRPSLAKKSQERPTVIRRRDALFSFSLTLPLTAGLRWASSLEATSRPLTSTGTYTRPITTLVSFSQTSSRSGLVRSI